VTGEQMRCSISDGPQTPEDVDFPVEEDEDVAGERSRQEEIDANIAPMTTLTGWTSSYYEIPKEAEELQDLIEHRDMNFAVGNIFKATYRLGHKENTSALYDLDKIIWFAKREKARLLRLQEGGQLGEVQGEEI
jgi:hypothetical protein